MKKQTLVKVISASVAGVMLAGAAALMIYNFKSGGSAGVETVAASGPITGEYKEKDTETLVGSTSAKITCSTSAASIEGEGADGVKESNGVITISKSGTYILTGIYTGQVLVNAGKNDFVHLILSGFNVTNESGSAISIVRSDKVTVTLSDGTENTVTDGKTYADTGDDAADAAIYADADLSFNGEGSLTVTGNYADAIHCKKDLKFISGTYNITAAANGIKGKNSVSIKDGTYTITSKKTAIKSTRTDKDTKGFVVIDGGNITINAGNDAIHAETHNTINGGNIDIQSSYEGIEGKMVDITGGTLNVVSSDDAFNATKISQKTTGTTTATDKNGTTSSSSGSTKSKPAEGTTNSAATTTSVTQTTTANVDTVSSATTKASGSQQSGNSSQSAPAQGGMPPQDNASSLQNAPAQGGGRGGMGGGDKEAVQEGVYLCISGGTINVYAGNDCFDSNGVLEFKGGTVYATCRNGITGADAVFDSNGGTTIDQGATIIAAGSGSGGGGMSTAITDKQNSMYVYPDSSQSQGSAITLKDAAGNIIASYTPTASYQGIMISSPAIATGQTYTLTAGSYSAQITQSEQKTTQGTASAGMGGGRGGMGGAPGGNDTAGGKQRGGAPSGRSSTSGTSN